MGRCRWSKDLKEGGQEPCGLWGQECPAVRTASAKALRWDVPGTNEEGQGGQCGHGVLGGRGVAGGEVEGSEKQDQSGPEAMGRALT